MGTLKKIGCELFVIHMYYELTEMYLPKQITYIFNTINSTHHRLQNGTILKFLIKFPHNELCLKKVAPVTFRPFLKIHNFIIYYSTCN